LLEREAFRQDAQTIGRHVAYLAIGSDRPASVSYPVTAFDVSDASAYRLNHA
jgi:hypothetical protein